MVVEVKCYRWVFTSWKRPVVREDLIHYMIWQKEYCPQTKLEHYQGYIEFNNPYKLFQVKSIFKDKKMYVDRARSSRQDNINYCTKNETYANERYEFGDIFTGILEQVEDVFDLPKNIEPLRKNLI